MDDPSVFVLWYDFTKWLLNKTEKFPKKVRFTFTNRVDNNALETLMLLVDARYNKEKKDRLKEINMNLEKLRILIRMSNDLGYIENKGYEYASKKINETGRMIGGWIRQQDKKK